MIVIGSYAAEVNGVSLRETVEDLDLIGTRDEVEAFRSVNAALIAGETAVGGHRIRFDMKPGCGFTKVEIDFEQSESDRMLPAFCRQRPVEALNISLAIPSINILYLTKRAHANNPVMYEKTIADLLRIKPHVTDFTDDEARYYKVRKTECLERYRNNRQRFQLAVSNDEFFAMSNHVRSYVHDDVHKAVAHDEGHPIYLKCKRDVTKAKIEIDLFEKLEMNDRLRMVQEEFMVIGLERYYLTDRSLSKQQVYDRGMHKTIRDLFVGYFQDFCIDNIDRLRKAPDFDFIKRFEDNIATGNIRQFAHSKPSVQAAHKSAWQSLRDGDLDEARRISEDLVRRADSPGDPHALHILGTVLSRQNKLEAAEKCLRSSLSIMRANAACWRDLGALMLRLGRTQEAVETLERALRFNPKMIDAYANLGFGREKLGDRPGAVQAYRAALRLRPQAARIRQRLQALLQSEKA